MKKTILTSIILVLSILFLVQCKKDPIPVNENELITRIDLVFTDSTDGSTQTFLYCINDAIYGNRKDTIKLYRNTLYSLDIRLFNSLSASSIDTITKEILEEDEEHQLFINSNSISNFSYLDSDDNNNPIGLISKFTTNDASTSYENFNITLIHEPDKNAAGVKQGNKTNAGGATDVDATLKIKINSRI